MMNYETRNDEDAPEGLDAAIQAVNDMRSASEQFRTELRNQLQTFGTRLDGFETRLGRPGGQGNGNTDEERQLERRAFMGFCRRDVGALTDVERRALRVADDGAGGFLAPVDFVAEVIKDIVEFSPVRQAARVGSTGSGLVTLPKRTGRPSVSWSGEIEESEETEASYGQIDIPVHQATAYIPVSNTLLEDASADLEAELRQDFAEDLGQAEGEVFVNGSGVKQPEGFMQASGISSTNNGHATVLQPDALITLLYAMPQFYRVQGAWAMNGTTLGLVRKLKDGQNNYLWQPAYQAGQPETLLGRPVIEMKDMPDVANGAYPIVYANFARGYRIYDRLSLNILRDPFTQARKAITLFHVRRRVGGGVVQPACFRKLKMAA
jgi:HK97 family phage major capsid protein